MPTQWNLFQGREAVQLSNFESVFMPSQPIRDPSLLKGRETQLQRTKDSLRVPGRSVFIYGERGVGKTSLAQTSAYLVNASGSNPVLLSCHPDLTFPGLMSKICHRLIGLPVFKKANKKKLMSAGFAAHGIKLLAQIVEEDRDFPAELDINDAVDILTLIRHQTRKEDKLVVVVDEVDTIESETTKRDLAYFIKHVGDRGCDISFVFAGIADDITDLLKRHESASRYMATIKLERLGPEELRDYVVEGFARANTKISANLALRIAWISDGFAHFVHLISLKTATAMIRSSVEPVAQVETSHFEKGLSDAISESEAWLKSAYDEGVKKYTDQYESILWAAADHWELERSTDDMYRSYCRICGDLDVDVCPRNSFSTRLNKLQSPAHSNTLIRTRRSWYKFRQTMLRGYCRMVANSRNITVGLEYLEAPDSWKPDEG